MAIKARAADSVGGPDGGSAWQCLDETVNVLLQASLGTTAVVTPIGIVPQASTQLAGGLAAPDALAAAIPIARLEGGQILNIGAATLALQAALATGILVFRAGAIVGGTIAFGWRATTAVTPTILGVASVPMGGDAGTPAFTLGAAPLQMPAVAANTGLTIPSGGAAYMNLQPGDLVALVQVMQTGTLATPQLAVSMKVV